MKLLTNYKFIGAIVFVVLAGGIFFIGLHQTTPSYVAHYPGNSTGINANQNSSSQATSSNQQTDDMAAKIKAQLDAAYSQVTLTTSNPYTPTRYPSNEVYAVKVSQQAGGGYDVHVDLNDHDAVYPEMSITYLTLYKQNTFNISNLSVSIVYQGQDKYGNQQENSAITTSLDSSDASKVNWNAQNLPYILEGLLNCTSDECSGGAPGPAVE